MPQSGWLNPASHTYQARRWARRRQQVSEVIGTKSTTPPTPDPGSQTESVRTSAAVANVAYVITTVTQPYGSSPLVLYPSSLVRPDPVNTGVAWLTVTDAGP
jgi:hypothetical protein